MAVNEPTCLKTGRSNLRREFRLFYKRKRDTTSEYARFLRRVLEKFRRADWQVYMFGGMLRDIVAFGPSAFPRDIDLVVRDDDMEEVYGAFSSNVERINRFGGFNFQFGGKEGWKVDLWPLSKTWAFQQAGWHGGRTFEDLPQTTFLNVEAVTMRLHTQNGSPRVIYENQFFEGMRDRVVDINFEPNPFPLMSAVRSLITALGLESAISYRLAEYIEAHAGSESIDRLVSLQSGRYGQVVLHRKWLSKLLSEIRRHLEEAPHGTPLALLPLLRTEKESEKSYQRDMMDGMQLSLWQRSGHESSKGSSIGGKASLKIAAFVHQQKLSGERPRNPSKASLPFEECAPTEPAESH